MTFVAPPIQSVPTPRVETRWRRIVTSIPAPPTLALIERLRAIEPRSTSGMPPVFWHEAEGFVVRDGCGNQWIDLTSGIVLANVGHGHPRIVQAIHDATKGPLATYTYAQQQRLELLEELIGISPIPDSKAILFSAGTEATECAMMLMRRHGATINARKVNIISFANGYHGRTLAASLAGGPADNRGWVRRESVGHNQVPFPFDPLRPESRRSDNARGEEIFAQATASLARQGITPDQIAGFIGEPLPGWSTWPIPAGYAKALRAWCDRHDILLCFDEVQCGCGRTGKMFGFEHFGVTPDLFTLGKGLTSSLPTSAVVGRRDLLDLPEPGQMSSTQGGNPICAAAALANLKVLLDPNENLIERAARTGRIVLDELGGLTRDYPDRVRSVHGKGLFISAHFTRPGSDEPDVQLTTEIANEAARRGVLMIVTGRGYIKFVPPLCIEPEAAVEAVAVIRSCVRDLLDQEPGSNKKETV